MKITEEKAICCGHLEKLDIYWMVTQEGVKLMPYIVGKDSTEYRINYCPSCGEYVRDCKR